GGEPIRRELPLHAQVPRVDLRTRDIRRNGSVRTAGGKPGGSTVRRVRERIPSGKGLPRIVQTDRSGNDRVSRKRRDIRRIVVQLLVHEIVGNAGGRANGEFPI